MIYPIAHQSLSFPYAFFGTCSTTNPSKSPEITKKFERQQAVIVNPNFIFFGAQNEIGIRETIQVSERQARTSEEKSIREGKEGKQENKTKKKSDNKTKKK